MACDGLEREVVEGEEKCVDGCIGGGEAMVMIGERLVGVCGERIKRKGGRVLSGSKDVTGILNGVSPEVRGEARGGRVLWIIAVNNCCRKRGIFDCVNVG